jgi:nucleoside-diphosphate-sugar epimerase
VKILCTGGGGYIGAILVPALLAAGHRVTVLDNFMHGEASLSHICAEPGFDVVRGDCRDYEVLAPLLQGVDAIIPLAALVGAPMCAADRGAAIDTNEKAILGLATLARRDQRILIPITNSGYGVGPAGEAVTEDSPLNPLSLYARTKVNAERTVMDRGNAISLRLATVFGMSPRMRLDLLVNDFVHRAVTDRAVTLFEPHFRRNYVHVRDVAGVFLHALENFDSMRDRVYNVGLSDANLSKAELCAKIARHVPGFVFHEAKIGEDPDKRDYVVSNERIEATGWRPAWSLDDGIRELIKGYRTLRNGRYGNV